MNRYYPMDMLNIPLLIVFIGYLAMALAEARDLFLGAKPALRRSLAALSIALLALACLDIFSGQEILLLLEGLSVFVVLWRMGIGLWATFLGTGAFLFNPLTIFSVYAFSNAHANIIFFLSALYALAVILQTEKSALRRLTLFVLAALLVFNAMFEFFPVLVWAFFLSLLLGGATRIQGIYCYSSTTSRRCLASLAACFGLACLAWLPALLSIHPNAALSASRMAANLVAHLGAQNLEPLLAVPSHWLPWLLSVSLVSAALISLFCRYPDRNKLIFCLGLLSVWMLYCCMIYPPVSDMGRDLYFFLPFTLFMGFLAHLADVLIQKRASAATKSLLCCALLGLYLRLSLRRVETLKDDYRAGSVAQQRVQSKK